MMTTPIRLLAVLTACILAGCSTTKQTPDAAATPAAETERVQRAERVSTMGSWIPRRKTKAELIGDGTTVVEGSALEKVQRAGAANVATAPSR